VYHRDYIVLLAVGIVSALPSSPELGLAFALTLIA
jgi:hypothetical protein